MGRSTEVDTMAAWLCMTTGEVAVSDAASQLYAFHEAHISAGPLASGFGMGGEPAIWQQRREISTGGKRRQPSE